MKSVVTSVSFKNANTYVTKEIISELATANVVIGMKKNGLNDRGNVACAWLNSENKWEKSGLSMIAEDESTVTCKTTHFSTFSVISDHSSDDFKPFWVIVPVVIGSFIILVIGAAIFLFIYKKKHPPSSFSKIAA